MQAVAVRDAEVQIVTDLYIGGRRVTGAGPEAVPIHNPFDNREICRIAPASADQVDAAVEAADRAFRAPDWKRLTGRERGALLYRLAALLRRDLAAFATLKSIEYGHTHPRDAHGGRDVGDTSGIFCGPRRQHRGQLPRSGRPLQLHAPRALRRHRPDRALEYASEAHGARVLRAAVACGNTMVVETVDRGAAEHPAICRNRWRKQDFRRARSISLTGSGRTVGKRIVEHPKVRKIIFTGGTEGGREILSQAVQTITPAVLELGGKGPIIVGEPIDWKECHRRRLTQAFARKAEVCFAGTQPVPAGEAA